MAHFNQQDKAKRAPAIRSILKKYGMKGSMSVSNYSTFVVTLKSGELNLIDSANRYNKLFCERRGVDFHPLEGHYSPNYFSAEENAREVGDTVIADFFKELVEAMLGEDYYNNSDAMTDYFDCSHYIDINVGGWDKPYIYSGMDKSLA